ncbi:MAG: SPOR domain-containing protein [Alphaproteobacteria bacterium]|nr:SPOR domain-containing protein [Alphaproteobacteria bacterium]
MSYGEEPERGEPPLTLGRRGGASAPPPPPARRPAPVTLIASLVILVGVVGAVAWLYRGGVRGPDGGPPTVGQSAQSARTDAPAQPATSDAAAGLSIYKDNGPTSDAATFTAGPETPQPRNQAAPPPAPAPTSQAATGRSNDAIGDLVDQSDKTPANRAPANSVSANAASAVKVAPKARSAAKPASDAEAGAPPHAAKAKAAAGGAGGIAVQIGAFSSHAFADSAWSAAASAAPGAMAGHGRQITPVTINGKTLYRAAITGFSSRADAVKLCAELKAAGRSCFVR